jgi:hypothetical protein
MGPWHSGGLRNEELASNDPRNLRTACPPLRKVRYESSPWLDLGGPMGAVAPPASSDVLFFTYRALDWSSLQHGEYISGEDGSDTISSW